MANPGTHARVRHSSGEDQLCPLFVMRGNPSLSFRNKRLLLYSRSGYSGVAVALCGAPKSQGETGRVDFNTGSSTDQGFGKVGFQEGAWEVARVLFLF